MLKLNPSKFKKVTKYALFYSFVIIIKISRECIFFSFFFFFLLQQFARAGYTGL